MATTNNRNSYEGILDLIDAEEFAEAISLCRRWLRHPQLGQHPDTPNIRYALGTVLYREERFAEVVTELQALNMPRSQLLVGFALRESEQYDQALQTFENYLKHNMRRPEIVVMTAICYEETGRYEDAIPLLREVETMKHSYKYLDDIYYHLGICFENSHDSGKAMESYMRLCDLFRDSHFYMESRFRLGYLYYRKGMFEKAAVHLNEVIAGGPAEKFYDHSKKLLIASKRSSGLALKRIQSYEYDLN